MDLLSVGIALIITKVLACVFRLYFGYTIGGLGIRLFFRTVFMPILKISGLSFLAGAICIMVISPSVLRIGMTTIVVESIFLPLVWFCLFSVNEREIVKRKLFQKLGNVRNLVKNS